MRAALKLIMIVVGLGLIAIAVGFVLLLAPLEKLARAQAETRLSRIYGSDVQLGGITFRPRAFALQIDDLVLNNPKGFREGAAVTCPRLLLVAEPFSLLRGTPRIREIRAEDVALDLRYELGLGTNVGQLLEAARSRAEIQEGGEGKGTVGVPSPEQPEERTPNKRVTVERFRCTGAKLILSTNLVPVSSAALEIAPFELDLREQAASPARLAAILLRSVVVEAVTLKGLLRPVAELLQEEIDKERIGP